MASVPAVAAALQTVLTDVANEQARRCGVIRRKRKFDGASLCQTLVFGWLAAPRAQLSDLCAAAAAVGVQVTRQGIHGRFTGGTDESGKEATGERLAAMLKAVLEAAVRQVLRSDAPVLGVLARFPAVIVEDGSVLPLPDELAEQWPGCGGAPGTSDAALKLALRFDLVSGQFAGPVLAAGRVHDGVVADGQGLPPPGSLYLVDLGYFGLERFRRLDAAGVYYLSRLRSQTTVIDAQDRRWRPGAFLAACPANRVDLPVRLGIEAKLGVRLLAHRLPQAVADSRRRRLHADAKRDGRTPDADSLLLCDWTVLITNCSSEQLTLAEADALLHARWQIELIWKLWKTDGGVRYSASAQPTHRLIELYAKLLGMLVQHWVMLTTRVSLLTVSRSKLAVLIRRDALRVARALHRGRGLHAVLREVRAAVHQGCRIARRKGRPATWERLNDPEWALT